MNQQGDELSRAFYSALGAQLRKEQTIERHAVVLPSQRTIDFGSPWMRVLHDQRGCQWRAACHHEHIGRVLTTREYALGRLEAGDGPEEIEDNIERLVMRHARGWRLSLVHCTAQGLSTLESVPVAGVWPVRSYEYNLAKRAGFKRRAMVEERWFRQLLRRYAAETRREWEAAGSVMKEPLFVPVKEDG